MHHYHVGSRVVYESLPQALKDSIPEEASSYIDEFEFYRTSKGKIRVVYAEELLAVWDGNGWGSACEVKHV